MKKDITSRQCGIAAESYAAYLLARSGYDVLVQYGANQPDYDLVAIKGERTLRISVKGSQDGSWMLAVRYVKQGVNYHAAIEKWLSSQPKDLIYVFVQFLKVGINDVPRTYVARPLEIADYMKSQCLGRGHGSLQENLHDHRHSRYNHEIPQSWKYSTDRIDNILL